MAKAHQDIEIFKFIIFPQPPDRVILPPNNG